MKKLIQQVKNHFKLRYTQPVLSVPNQVLVKDLVMMLGTPLNFNLVKKLNGEGQPISTSCLVKVLPGIRFEVSYVETCVLLANFPEQIVSPVKVVSDFGNGYMALVHEFEKIHWEGISWVITKQEDQIKILGLIPNSSLSIVILPL